MKEAIDKFLDCKNIAIVGMSHSSPKFGNLAYKELKNKDYKVYPIHPKSQVIDGAKCFNTFDSIEENIEAVLVSVKPEQSEGVVKAAHQNGINNIWLQQGAESESTIYYCKENGINIIHGQCILMHAKPVKGIHGVHRWFKKAFGKLPK
jgi:predicted CoA-binding protein